MKEKEEEKKEGRDRSEEAALPEVSCGSSTDVIGTRYRGDPANVSVPLYETNGTWLIREAKRTYVQQRARALW